MARNVRMRFLDAELDIATSFCVSVPDHIVSDEDVLAYVTGKMTQAVTSYVAHEILAHWRQTQ